MQATVLLADYANLTANGKPNVMGVFRQIYAHQFPCRHLSMYLVIILQTDPIEESRGEHILAARLIDADGSVLRQLEIPFRFPERSSGIRPEATMIFRIDHIEFPYPGDYAWHILIENENIGQYEFYLNQQ
jgi:hypothetical protein